MLPIMKTAAARADSSTEPTTEPEDEFLTLRDVTRMLGRVHPTTIFRMRQRGEFPEPFRLTPGRIAWSRRDIAKWIEGRRGRVA